MLRETPDEENADGLPVAADESLDALVRRVDADRWFATRFADARVRLRLLALYAANYEVARIAESVSDPALGRIRLQWWIDAVGRASRSASVEHPALILLSEAVQETGLDLSPLVHVFEARNSDLEESPFAAWSDLEAYVDTTAGGVIRVAAALCAPERALSPHTLSLARAAGRAWGLIGLLRALPNWGARRRTFFPTVLFERIGFTPEDLYAGTQVHEITAAIRVVLERARAAHSDANRLSTTATKDLFPAYGYVTLFRDYARGLENNPPSATIGVFRRQARLVGAALTGAV